MVYLGKIIFLIIIVMACLPTAGIIGSIVSGAAGAFGTIRGLLPGGSRKSKEVNVTNKNRRHSVTTFTNSHNRHRTSVETLNYFRNDYYGDDGQRKRRKTRRNSRSKKKQNDLRQRDRDREIRVESSPAQIISVAEEFVASDSE